VGGCLLFYSVFLPGEKAGWGGGGGGEVKCINVSDGYMEF
jgi:hypothetical protein